MKALTIKNLTFSYIKNQKAIDNVSFEIEQGEYIAFLGHNGSGKSTLAKLIVGLLPAQEGEIEISGIQLNSDNINQIRNKIAIVFQNPDNQFIGATVEDDIAFSLENRNVPRDEMLRLVPIYAEKVGVLKFLNKEPGYLSGGQKQRVAIADALIINPDILVLDEATSMLDPKGKKEILQLIRQMRHDNPKLTIISITHDVEEAKYSDRILLLENGKIATFDTPEKIFTNEQLIKDHNLDVPFVYEMQKELKKRGIACETDKKALEDAICRLKWTMYPLPIF